MTPDFPPTAAGFLVALRDQIGARVATRLGLDGAELAELHRALSVAVQRYGNGPRIASLRHKSPAWNAGYNAAMDAHDAGIGNVALSSPPAHYSLAECGDFHVGFYVGMRDARNHILIDEWEAE